MRINADFARPVRLEAGSLDWVPSPVAGVERRMLDRVGGEVARATSLVRYAPGSRFSAHSHGGGEEFVVLEGTFEDEHGAYPPGSYVRNPPGSSHTPGAGTGCTIFVKLWQFAPDDGERVRLRMEDRLGPATAGVAEGLLFEGHGERVRLLRLAPGAALDEAPAGGSEWLVLSGTIATGDGTLPRFGWLRLPPGTPFAAVAGPGGADLWVKSGHLDPLRGPSA